MQWSLNRSILAIGCAAILAAGALAQQQGGGNAAGRGGAGRGGAGGGQAQQERPDAAAGPMDAAAMPPDAVVPGAVRQAAVRHNRNVPMPRADRRTPQPSTAERRFIVPIAHFATGSMRAARRHRTWRNLSKY